jgi:hypothetical protein
MPARMSSCGMPGQLTRMESISRMQSKTHQKAPIGLPLRRLPGQRGDDIVPARCGCIRGPVCRAPRGKISG